MKNLKLFIIPILSILLITNLFSQERKSAHQIHQEKFGVQNLSASQVPGGEGIMPLQKSLKKEPSVTVFGFLPDWEYLANSQQYFRYDLLTHIGAFDFGVDGEGNITFPAGWPWTDVINEAHSNGVKVVMVAVNFDEDNIRSILTDSDAQNNFITNAISIIDEYNLDGINIDFEGPYTDDRGSRMNDFMTNLTTQVHFQLPGKEVSFDSPAVNWGGWDFAGLAASCDYLFIMGYDFYGSWSDNSGPSAPYSGGSINVLNTVNTQYSAVTNSTPEKLVLGVPYYGLHFITEGQNANSEVKEFVNSPRYRSSHPLSEVYGRQWSLTYKVPWFNWNTGEWNQIWYDDAESLEEKYDLADVKGFKGVGMWALGYDGERQELWNLLDLKYGSGEIPAPALPPSFRVVGDTDSTLRLQYDIPQNATGFKVMFSTDGETFADTAEVTGSDIVVEGLDADSAYYFKVKAYNQTGESPASEVLAGVPGLANQSVLVINGFDRISGTSNTQNFIRMYAKPLTERGFAFASASNEAVYLNKVDLTDYQYVIWILGDESTSDETFNSFEQELTKEYLRQGGNLVVTGAEVGWDLVAQGGGNDADFYHNYLKADYVRDAPNNNNGLYYSCEPVTGGSFENLSSFDFDDGTHGTYDVDWPDAIKARGGENIIKYQGVDGANGYAGVAYKGEFPNGTADGGVVYLAVPFETIYPESKRIELMDAVFNYLQSPVSVQDEKDAIPTNFVLEQNYPNPFNPTTTIGFTLPQAGNAKLQIYNSLGQLINSFNFDGVSAGYHSVIWNGDNSQGARVSSGTYLYRVIYTNNNGDILTRSKKMILLK